MHILIKAVVAPVLLLAAPSEPAGDYTREELDTVIKVGFHEFDRMKDRCVRAEGEARPASIDVEAELAFIRMAEMVQLVVLNYPYPNDLEAQRQHSDDVQQAVQGYERAYACNPGWDRREYLNRAIALLEVRIRQIGEVERRPSTAPDAAVLQQSLVRLRALQNTLRPPPPCSAPRACPVSNAPGPKTSPTHVGYRGKYMDLLSLRIEVAGGFASELAVSDDAGASQVSAPRPIMFSLAPGVRFLAGKRERHVFNVGFRWALVSATGDLLQQFTANIGYGIRLHPRWVSIHGAFEPGMQMKPSYVSFGRPQFGGSGSLCTWNEAFCVRIGGYGVITEDTYLIGSFAGLGFDVFRVVDNLLQRGDESM